MIIDIMLLGTGQFTYIKHKRNYAKSNNNLTLGYSLWPVPERDSIVDLTMRTCGKEKSVKMQDPLNMRALAADR